MKKVKITGKLNLDKMAIAKLNDSQTLNVVGGSTRFPICGRTKHRLCIQKMSLKTDMC